MKNIFTKTIFVILFILSGVIVSAQSLDWADGMGGSNSDWAWSVAVDGSGNTYITGRYWITADFDPGPGVANLTGPGADIFVAKYDADGKYVWAISIGDYNHLHYGYGIVVDGAGNVYVTGDFGGTVDFDPGPGTVNLTASGFNAFVAKYDSNGNYVWAKNLGGSSSDVGMGIALDSTDNVYVTGYFYDTADFDPGPGTANLVSAGDYDVFLAKYDSSGNYIWARSMGGNDLDYGYGIAVGKDGAAYISGYFNGTADFDPGSGVANLTSLGGTDIFVAKYDSNGNYVWANGMGSAKLDQSRYEGVAVDGSGNAYITGFFQETVDFDPGAGTANLTSAGSTDIFVAKYDSNGNYVWAKSIGGEKADYGQGIALDKAGNVYTTGYFSDTVDFDPGPGTFYLTTDTVQAIFLNRLIISHINTAFVSKLDAAGNFVWAKSMRGKSYKGSTLAWSVAVNKSGSVYVAGRFRDTVDLDTGSGVDTLMSAGNDEIFLLKFACSDTSSAHIIDSMTCGGSYILNGIVYTTNGTYTQIIPNASGCDSTITLDLTITSIAKPIINVDSFTLGVTGTYATYQWIKDGMLIPGATDSTYTVMSNGSYQVVVTNENGCSDTSDVYPITNYTGITDVHLLAKYIKVYPNPTADKIYIQSPVKMNIALTDMQGRVIRKVENAHSLSVKDLAAGMYLLRITSQNGVLIKTEKIVRQKQ